MKSFSLIIGILLLFATTTFAGKVEKTYKFANPSFSQIDNYQVFTLDNTMPTALYGQPLMPYRQVNLMLPPGEAAVGIEIIFSGEVALPGKYSLYPQQEARPLSGSVSGNFIKDNDIYGRNAIFPADPKGKLMTSYLNGRSFALTTFSPAQYNPVTGKLSYFTEAKVVIRTAKDTKAEEALENLDVKNKQALKLADNREMDQSYQSRQKTTTGNYDLLIITTTAFKNSFTGLQAGYQKEGITSLVVTRDSITSTMTGQDTPEKIRNFIIQEYQTHGIQYVLLGGDIELIPHRGFYCYVISGSGYSDQNIPSDLYYSALDGNWNNDGDAFWGEPGEDDLLPDVAVARMPFSFESELNNMLNKSYKYQFEPVANEFRNIIMAGENLYYNPDTWGSDYLELLKGEHSDNGYTTIGIPQDYPFDYMYDETNYWTGQDLMYHLNQGRPMLNHVGHANETYVMKLSNSDITNANFFGLNGIDHNFTVVYTHGCLCGAFDYNDCIAEKMVTINNFAAAFVGNSRYGWFNEGQTEGPSAHLHREFIDALYTDSLNRIAVAHMESKIETASWVTAPGQWEPGALRWCFYDCNVLGDPAFAVFTDSPIELSANYPSTVLIGTPSIEITISSGGNPAPGLTCVAMKDGIVIGKSVTNASGLAIINFDIPIQDAGDAQIIVSGYNCKPTTYNFAFLAVAGPYVVYAHSLVNDPAGNQNNQPDFSETILLTTGMRNVGGTDASNVMVTLSTTDPYITITDSTQLFPSIPSGDTVTIINAFEFIISDTIPDGHEAHFVLKAESGSVWFSDFVVTCYAPVLSVGSMAIDDSGSGNGDGKLDPGETAILSIQSSNNGNASCGNVTGTLTTTSPWITVMSAVYPIGNLSAGASSNAQFEVQVSIDAPAATIVELEYVLTSGGYQATAAFFPTIKLIAEDFESGDYSKFPWSTLGQKFWQISEVDPLEGKYCSRSAFIGHNEQSTMNISLNVLANDSISFYSKVSSEEIFDNLKFFIDIQTMGEWSGIIPWQRHSYPVSAGLHTFKWVYTKDMGTSTGSDCAWVDFIVFPSFVDYTGIKDETTEQISMSLSPNPVKDEITIKANLISQISVVLQISNSEGRDVLAAQEILSDKEGNIVKRVDVSSWKPGYYTCTIKCGNINISRAFIVN